MLERMTSPRSPKAGSSLFIVGAPENYLQFLDPLPADVTFARRLSPTVNIVHLFTTKNDELIRHLGSFRNVLEPEAVIWVSWPKKVSKVAAEVTEDTIRGVALPLGLVDVRYAS
jgi:hypothetical protein